MLAIGRALTVRPKLMLLDEPSMGLAPLLVADIFAIVDRLNREEKVSVLLAEQNAAIALRFARRAYVMESGRIVLDGDAATISGNEDVKRVLSGPDRGGPAQKLPRSEALQAPQTPAVVRNPMAHEQTPRRDAGEEGEPVIPPRRLATRFTLNESLEVLEVDWSNLAFTSDKEMDEFFDEVDGALQASGRRWYFLVDYTGCTFAPTVWEHFAERGKRTNITHGLGTVRYGPRSRRPGRSGSPSSTTSSETSGTAPCRARCLTGRGTSSPTCFRTHRLGIGGTTGLLDPISLPSVNLDGASFICINEEALLVGDSVVDVATEGRPACGCARCRGAWASVRRSPRPTISVNMAQAVARLLGT